MVDLKRLSEQVFYFLQKEEMEFSKRMGVAGGSLLAEHSLRVANIARRIAMAIGGDGDIAYVAGLLHDLGKFRRKMYRKDEIEEYVSIELARNLLSDNGFKDDFVDAVLSAIEDLVYKKPRTKEAAALYDADILDKTGAHGFLNVVAKYSSMGESVIEILEKRASGDITYLENLPIILSTSYARNISEKYRNRGLSIYKWIFDEMKEIGFEFEVKELFVKNVKIVLVKRKLCPKCNDSTFFDYNIRKDIKDEVIEFKVFCKCGWKVRFGFCIPQVFNKPLY